jgi:hypothetical protein
VPGKSHAEETTNMGRATVKASRPIKKFDLIKTFFIKTRIEKSILF